MKKLSIVSLFLVNSLLAISHAAPTIHVAWDESIALEEDTHYEIDTEVNGTPESPNVILKAGSLTWRVWSVDSLGGPGDIGEISSPADASFGVRILGPEIEGAPSPGARNIRSINLVPTDEAYHSSILEGLISGDITESMTLQASAGNGGSVTILIDGDLSADASIPRLDGLTVNTLSGALEIGTLAGTIGILSFAAGGSIHIDQTLSSLENRGK